MNKHSFSCLALEYYIVHQSMKEGMFYRSFVIRGCQKKLHISLKHTPIPFSHLSGVDWCASQKYSVGHKLLTSDLREWSCPKTTHNQHHKCYLGRGLIHSLYHQYYEIINVIFCDLECLKMVWILFL
jgi:hypothetical protein